MGTILATLLFSAALLVAMATIVATILPQFARIRSLLTDGVRYRMTPLPAPRPRTAPRPMPRLTALPARLRAAA